MQIFLCNFLCQCLNPAAGQSLLVSMWDYFLDVNGNPSGSAIASALTYSSATNTLTLNPTADLTASTSYVVTVAPTTTSSTDTAFMGFRLYFRTASGAADTTRPTITGVFPGVNAASVALPISDISIGFSEDMDASTITSANIAVNNSITGTVTYNPGQRAAHFSPNVPLSTSTTYTVTITSGASGVKDLSGNQLGGNGGVANAVSSAATSTNYVYTFGTSATADTTTRQFNLLVRTILM